MAMWEKVTIVVCTIGSLVGGFFLMRSYGYFRKEKDHHLVIGDRPENKETAIKPSTNNP